VIARLQTPRNRELGNLLVVAVLVAPAAAARRVADRVPTMMAAAIAIAIA